MTTEIKESSKAPYQLLPPLADEEYQALKADIAEHGILVPIEVDEAGNMLDGHHRVKAWGELRAEGIKVPDYPRLVRVGLTEAQKRNHVRCLNLLRRHLSKEQLKEQMEAMRRDGMTYQAIAEVAKVDVSTVKRTIDNSEIANAKSEITNIRGQKRPAKYKPRTPKTVMALDAKDEGRALSAIEQAQGALPDKVITTKRAGRIGREQDAQRRRQQSIPERTALTDSLDIRRGDFQEVLHNVSAESVDLIFTDPPYGKKYLDLWKSLAQFAKRVLKPGGWLITYSGQRYLPEVILTLSSELQYAWIIAQRNTSSKKNIIRHVKIYSQWKPILLFAKPPLTPLDWCNDMIDGGGQEKDLHEWQQAELEASYCIERFSLPSQLVVDPFLGTGTTAMASQKLGRKFIGCDTDAAAISKTLERLKDGRPL